MIDTPEIVETSPLQTAVVPVTIPRAEIRTAMGEGYNELMSAIAAQGITPAGPWFTQHLKMDPEVFDFQIGVPVDEPVVAAGRVRAGELPAMKVARTVYHGGYEGLGKAWGELDAWVTANGHTPAPGLQECYLAGPESSENSAEWRTELCRPLL